MIKDKLIYWLKSNIKSKHLLNTADLITDRSISLGAKGSAELPDGTYFCSCPRTSPLLCPAPLSCERSSSIDPRCDQFPLASILIGFNKQLHRLVKPLLSSRSRRSIRRFIDQQPTGGGRGEKSEKKSNKSREKKSEETNSASFFSSGSLIWLSLFIYLSSLSLSLFPNWGLNEKKSSVC